MTGQGTGQDRTRDRTGHDRTGQGIGQDRGHYMGQDMTMANHGNSIKQIIVYHYDSMMEHYSLIEWDYNKKHNSTNC